MIVPDDVLLPLPFAALVTESASEEFLRSADSYRAQQVPSTSSFRDYSKLSWLANRYAITVLPSASTLRLLRRMTGGMVPGREPFIGFGDPMLRGKGHTRGGAMLRTRGDVTTLKRLQLLDRLPGTRDELMAIAKALGASVPSNLFLGAHATEPEVRRLNASGRLGEAEVLSFATHGLLAGEVQGLTQPALVLSLPEKPTEEDDGLLAMDEILQLKLSHTSWVILSACNTGAGDGSGEGLTGLARAFFFAGAKALLVSQWSVDDLATQELMTQIFQRYGRDKQVSPAEALRQGMLALLKYGTTESHHHFAHPYAWAAFFLVGEGTARARP
jgi:CHAT domain-containing protein